MNTYNQTHITDALENDFPQGATVRELARHLNLPETGKAGRAERNELREALRLMVNAQLIVQQGQHFYPKANQLPLGQVGDYASHRAQSLKGKPQPPTQMYLREGILSLLAKNGPLSGKQFAQSLHSASHHISRQLSILKETGQLEMHELTWRPVTVAGIPTASKAPAKNESTASESLPAADLTIILPANPKPEEVRHAALTLLTQNRQLTGSQIRNALIHASRHRDVDNALQRLKNAGRIECVGSTNPKRWQLTATYKQELAA